MDIQLLKNKLPTFFGWWEKRQYEKRNQLPSHMRPVSKWPIWIQLTLNIGIIYTLYSIMVGQDEFLTDVGPAIVMAICLVFLLFTIPTAIRMKRRYVGIEGQRLSKVNFWFMIAAFLMWPLTVAFYL